MPDVQLPLVDGVNMHSWFSFPSGHTTSFFALAFVLCILLTSQKSTIINHKLQIALQIILVFFATLGAYSRIYLSQHFALDVFAGICVGIGITMLMYVIFYRFEGQKWYNYRLFTKK